MIDNSLKLLMPALESPTEPTLWFADEGALEAIRILNNQQQPLHIITNRYDLYQLAKGFAHSINKGEVVVKHEAENVKEGDVPF